MQPRFEILSEKKLIGKKLWMSFAVNKTFELWSGFMPRRKEIKNTINNDLFSIEIYPPHFFDNFDSKNIFEKWAAVEVSDYNHLPNEMKALTIPTGLYAVFIHHGLSSNAVNTYDFIFREWLSKSEYKVDQRPHFAVMGDKFQKENPNSEEEIWIPINRK